ncbi:MAG: hypothetical protein R3300_16465 [Candidatus Promineifilaceae bacterium]|nr:hypothetical protein [Candidatus Promineifilaceae bacterium]
MVRPKSSEALSSNTIKRITVVLWVLFLLYGASLVLFSREGFPVRLRFGEPFPYLADKPVGEDGYYMLTVAWNLADTGRLTYNFGELTSGVQPLATVLYGALAFITQQLGGDKWLFTRIVLVFGVINLLVCAHLVGLIAAHLSRQHHNLSDLAYFLAFLAIAFNFELFRWFTYGLETGLYLTLLATAVLLSLRFHLTNRLSWKRVALLGAVMGLTGLARLDFGIILAGVLLLGIVSKTIKVEQALAVGAIALLVVAPWLAYICRLTGSFIPSSGSAQAALISAQDIDERLLAATHALLNQLTPWVYLRVSIWLRMAAIFSLGAVLFLLLVNLNPVRLLQATRKHHPYILIWVAAITPILLVYPLFFWAQHLYNRYFTPITIVYVPILATLLAYWLPDRSRKVQLATVMLMPLFFFGWTFRSLHTGRLGNTHVISAGYIDANVAAAEKVGAFQSGVIGFYNSNTVNLDGKMNAEALAYRQAGNIEHYIEREGIDVLIDWKSVLATLEHDWLRRNWQPCPDFHSDFALCLVRR